jgi:hypothetical protein
MKFKNGEHDFCAVDFGVIWFLSILFNFQSSNLHTFIRIISVNFHFSQGFLSYILCDSLIYTLPTSTYCEDWSWRKAFICHTSCLTHLISHWGHVLQDCLQLVTVHGGVDRVWLMLFNAGFLQWMLYSGEDICSL